MNPWILPGEIKSANADAITAAARVPKNCVWFEGHFPGEPILPGIALVSAVYNAISQDARARNEALELRSLRRIRFSRPVRPGEALEIVLNRESAEKEIRYGFKVSVEDNIVCSGIVAAAPSEKN